MVDFFTIDSFHIRVNTVFTYQYFELGFLSLDNFYIPRYSEIPGTSKTYLDFLDARIY